MFDSFRYLPVTWYLPGGDPPYPPTKSPASVRCSNQEGFLSSLLLTGVGSRLPGEGLRTARMEAPGSQAGIQELTHCYFPLR
jgi:hypothetical protein